MTFYVFFELLHTFSRTVSQVTRYCVFGIRLCHAEHCDRTCDLHVLVTTTIRPRLDIAKFGRCSCWCPIRSIFWGPVPVPPGLTNGRRIGSNSLLTYMYKVMNGMAPRYLGPFVRVADLPGRRALRSAVTNRLTVPAVKLSTSGSRAFSVSGPHTWKQLPEEITSAASLSTFQRHLKTFLFRKSFPDIIAD